MSSTSKDSRTVFGVVAGNTLLYGTLKSNPSKSLRFYDRMGREDRAIELVRFSMRRARKAGDVSGLHGSSLNREPYIGPMR